jgi:hypothetical protein
LRDHVDFLLRGARIVCRVICMEATMNTETNGTGMTQLLDLDAPAVAETAAYYARIGDLTPNRATVTRAYASAAELRSAAAGKAVGVVVRRADEPFAVGERIWLAAVESVRAIPRAPTSLRREISRLRDDLLARPISADRSSALVDVDDALDDAPDWECHGRRTIAAARQRLAARIAAEHAAQVEA